MNIIHKDFTWTEKNYWDWPDEDLKGRRENSLLGDIDSVAEVDVIMGYVTCTDTCVQAGAACGIWPHKLSTLFEKVYSFEPHRENFIAASRNLEGCGVFLRNVALGNGLEGGFVTLEQNPLERHNVGSWQVGMIDRSTQGLAIEVTTIDSELTDDDSVGLIALDLEGYEHAALDGALTTILEQHPVIYLEDKGHSRKYGVPQGSAIEWLSRVHGYRVVEQLKHNYIMVYPK